MHCRGSPAKRCGLIKSGFRPSDDSNHLPFFIPGNAMLAVELDRISINIEKANIKSDLIE